MVVWWYFEVNFDTFQWNSITFLFESFRSLCNFSPYSMLLCVFINEKNFKISRVLSCIICPSYLIYCILSEKGKKKPRHFLGKIMCTLRRITTTFNFILEKWKKNLYCVKSLGFKMIHTSKVEKSIRHCFL